MLGSDELGGDGVAKKFENCSCALSGPGAATFGDLKKKIKREEEEL